MRASRRRISRITCCRGRSPRSTRWRRRPARRRSISSAIALVEPCWVRRWVICLEKKMNERGYLEGSEMASTFNLLRSNDLVWSFVINNYLLGKNPFPFDLLYWNADSTRMPARMHSFYLRNMYIRNRLGVPGGITLSGVPIDLSKVDVPAYFISTAEDHISPWKTTYKGSKYLSGEVRFVLGGSGHIAGVINPPAAKKYQYWTNDARPATADE